MQLPKLSPRWQRALMAVGYMCFYSFALTVFSYWTFPYDRLRDRVQDEFNSRQTGPSPMRLELDSVSSYWLSGIEASGIRLISPPKPVTPGSEEANTPPKPTVLTIDSAHARVALLPLLIGSVKIHFGASAFDGSISGQTSESDGTRKIELEMTDLSLEKATLLGDIIGLPLSGKVNGQVELMLPEGKFTKADGKVELKIHGLAAGDGKAKIRDTIALPKLEAGDLVFNGEAATGQFKVAEFSAQGPDLELVSEGSIRLRDPLSTSLLTLSTRFHFTDRYTNKNDTTRGIFGAPGSSIPGLFDLDAKNKRAKGPDGFYGWRVSGTLNQPLFMPQPMSAPAGASKVHH
jgi:type II secretion system protein N